jgi:hypothetical protein
MGTPAFSALVGYGFTSIQRRYSPPKLLNS